MVDARARRAPRRDGDLPRRAAGRAAAEGARREQAVHALGRASVLDLRRLSRGGHRDRRRAPRVDGGVRGRGLGEGHARAGRVRADGRPGRDERDERDGLGAGQPLADGRARRPRAGAALGAGLAAGDRPRAVRAPADASSRRRPERPRRSPGSSTTRSRRRVAPHGGPAFVDFPLDYVFMEAAEPRSAAATRTRRRRADAGATGRARRARRSSAPASCSRGAERPVIMAGTDLYWGHGEQALLELAETLRIPVFLNGLARGCVPADHELFFSRARSQGLKGADVALVVGVPMDFRLGVRRPPSARTPRSSWSTPPSPSAPPARGRGRVLRVDRARRSRELRAAGGGAGAGERGVGRRAARGRDRAPRGRARRARGRPRAAAPDAPVRRARRRCSTATRS